MKLYKVTFWHQGRAVYSRHHLAEDARRARLAVVFIMHRPAGLVWDRVTVDDAEGAMV